MKNVLITGGAGFIGSNLALKLYEKGYNVTILDNLSKQIHGDNPDSSSLFCSIKKIVNFIHGSVTNRNDWMKALTDQDYVIHLAAETGTGQSMYEITKYCDVNINGTALFLDIITNNPNNLKKVVVASSRAVYGEGKYFCKEHGNVFPLTRNEIDLKNKIFDVKCPICNSIVKNLPTDEYSTIHPSSIYGITKQVQEEMVHCICSAINIPSVAFRYQNVYGPGQSLKNPYTGILSIFSNTMRLNRNINIFEDGLESRDFVYIDDVVNATILGLENDNANYQTFNVGTGISIDVLTVAKLIAKSLNSTSNIDISGNFRIGDIRHNIADLTKIVKYLDFKPQVSFEEGIELFCNWVKTQNIEDDKYEKSLLEMKNKGLYK